MVGEYKKSMEHHWKVYSLHSLHGDPPATYETSVCDRLFTEVNEVELFTKVKLRAVYIFRTYLEIRFDIALVMTMGWTTREQNFNSSSGRDFSFLHIGQTGAKA